MKLSATTEMKMPPKRAYRELTDFGAFETLLAERGAELVRSSEPDPPGPGTRWEGTVPFNGVARDVTVEVTEAVPDARLCFALTGPGLEGTAEIALTEASKRATRVAVEVNVTPRTMRGRILIQPLKLAHATLEARFADRVDRLARAIEKRRRKI